MVSSTLLQEEMEIVVVWLLLRSSFGIRDLIRLYSRCVLGPRCFAILNVFKAPWGSGTPKITKQSSVSRFLDLE